MADNKFPKLEAGFCDGLGCGGILCYCKIWLESREEFQRVFDKAWNKDDPDCKIWEKAWRLGYKVTEEYYEPKVTNMKERHKKLIKMEQKSCEVKLKQLESKLK